MLFFGQDPLVVLAERQRPTLMRVRHTLAAALQLPLPDVVRLIDQERVASATWAERPALVLVDRLLQARTLTALGPSLARRVPSMTTTVAHTVRAR